MPLLLGTVSPQAGRPKHQRGDVGFQGLQSEGAEAVTFLLFSSSFSRAVGTGFLDPRAAQTSQICPEEEPLGGWTKRVWTFLDPEVRSRSPGIQREVAIHLS